MNTPKYASVNNLTETNQIKIGDMVRSYDQEFKPFSWVKGEVVGFEEVEGIKRCVIVVKERESLRCPTTGSIEKVVMTKELFTEGAKKVYPPVNGTRLAIGTNLYSNFIEKVA